MYMRWSQDDLEKAIDLFKEGNRFRTIGEKLGRSRKSVTTKLNNLGYFYKEYNKPIKKYCLNCNEEIPKQQKFCSRSCSATYNNKLKTKYNKCLNCNKDTRNSKYCDHKCNSDHKRNIKFTKIEEGDTTLDYRNYKSYLIFKYGDKCMECGWSEVNKKTNRVPIELEHIDGNSENNSLSNLKLLCPNCHSLTPTYKGLNIGNGRYKRMLRYYDGRSF